MRALDWTWFTNKDGCIGIVKAETDEGIEYFIGQARGFNENDDIDYIMEWGANFTRTYGERLFGKDEILPLKGVDEGFL